MKYFQLLVLVLIVTACSDKTEQPTKDPVNKEPTTEKQTSKKEQKVKEDLVVVKGHTFTQYYPGKKNIEFQGPQDDQKRRHGKWSYFNVEGKELSTTMYSHGKKHGHMIVKHDNGAIYYHGEMSEDKKIGIWKNYDRDGVFIGETDFGEAK